MVRNLSTPFAFSNLNVFREAKINDGPYTGEGGEQDDIPFEFTDEVVGMNSGYLSPFGSLSRLRRFGRTLISHESHP